MNSRNIGAYYETLARRYLERAGLTFIDANVILQHGELDLIMRERDILVFVEVRYRQNANFGDALTSITISKRQKLLRTAALWLLKRGQSLDSINCRFDIVAITGCQLQWLPNAFSHD